MSVQTADYLDLITRLPPGGRLTLYEIAWEEYEQLLDQLPKFADFLEFIGLAEIHELERRFTSDSDS